MIDGEPNAGDLVQRRWSWPGQTDGRFTTDPTDASQHRPLPDHRRRFYEFMDGGKQKKRKDKWLFTKEGEPWFCIAGIWPTKMSARPSRC
jgi:putative SOS response-associated peptidase YedK